MQVADKLKKFQNKEAKKKDFRILQGVLSKSFSRREQTFTEQLTLRKAAKDQKRKMFTLQFLYQQILVSSLDTQMNFHKKQ